MRGYVDVDPLVFDDLVNELRRAVDWCETSNLPYMPAWLADARDDLARLDGARP